MLRLDEPFATSTKRYSILILPKDGGAAPDLWPFFHAIPPVPTLLVWGQESTVLSAGTVQRPSRTWASKRRFSSGPISPSMYS